MIKKLKTLRDMEFDLVQLIIMTICYGAMVYSSLTYWSPVVKSLGVLAILVLPVLIVLWLSASKYVKAFENVLVDYAVIMSIIILASTLAGELRHEQLYYITTASCPTLVAVMVMDFISDVHLRHDIEMMRSMCMVCSDITMTLYVILTIAGIGYYKSYYLFLANVLTYVIVKISLILIMRYVLNGYAEKTKNNK